MGVGAQFVGIDASAPEDDRKPARFPPSSGLQGILDRADQVLGFPFVLVGLAIGLQLCVTDELPGFPLDRTLDLLARPDDTVLIHVSRAG